ncbi:(d)CMP kinase [[Mycoplasma] collis]|uniref:(d)CMP kinase n=1 Tax=[Mycoplasma] collis TaxID=2127 RepID=UPI00051BB2A0|nr:(d)CMP kinase [[Mycoplasma] collis]
MKKINVAIDGPSGVGKSTISEKIAKKYNFIFVNTGTFYRTIAFYFLSEFKNDLNVIKNKDFVLKNWNMDKITLNENKEVLLNKENPSDKLRTDIVSQGASIIATYKEIRTQIVNFLKNLSKKDKGFIMEGRDTTFSVLPHAEVKIFLWASPEVRAKRRVQQNKELGIIENYEDVFLAIKERDYLDQNREFDPLHQTPDSWFIDSSNMTMMQVVEEISKLIEKIIYEK